MSGYVCHLQILVDIFIDLYTSIATEIRPSTHSIVVVVSASSLPQAPAVTPVSTPIDSAYKGAERTKRQTDKDARS
jgi:choline dehydrogenase-like flavoprotein